MADGQELLETLKGEVESLRTSEGWLAWLDVARRLHRYSANNQLLIALQRPDATMVMAYGAKDGSTGWLSLNRRVRKGEKGIRILAPMVCKGTDANGDETRFVKGFKSVAVFDVAQTEGEPLPPSPAQLWRDALAATTPDAADESRWDALNQVAQTLGREVIVHDTDEDNEAEDGALGWVRLSSPETIHVMRGSPGQMAATLAHELSHSLDPELRSHDRTYAEKELLAESSAWLVTQELGMAQTPVSAVYLAGFDGSAEKLAQVAEQALKVSRQIIEALPVRGAEEQAA